MDWRRSIWTILNPPSKEELIVWNGYGVTLDNESREIILILTIILQLKPRKFPP